MVDYYSEVIDIIRNNPDWKEDKYGPSADGPTFIKGIFRVQILSHGNLNSQNLPFEINTEIWRVITTPLSWTLAFRGCLNSYEELEEILEKLKNFEDKKQIFY